MPNIKKEHQEHCREHKERTTYLETSQEFSSLPIRKWLYFEKEGTTNYSNLHQCIDQSCYSMYIKGPTLNSRLIHITLNFQQAMADVATIMVIHGCSNIFSVIILMFKP